MQPNKYQTVVLDDLRAFLVRWLACKDPVLAYRAHWDEKGAARMPPYQPQPHGAPQICTKVPTAGGKTLIGIYALREVLGALGKRRGEPRLCIWLVPSLSIKDQVLNRFNAVGDGYWLALREALGGQVSVLSKEQLLAGGGQFNADDVRDEVVIAVLTYDSLRAKNKDDRKLYQQNGALASFGVDVAESDNDDDVDPESLVAAVASLNPVIIVDESHNATSELSREMLARLKPSCVVELTATPRIGANIVSYVDAMALRDAHMVKLPVVVRNLPDQAAVIAHAIDLRARLEAEAKAEQAEGGTYIRPIVLFQAEPKNKDDSLSFEKLRDELVKHHTINPDWVKIKTANVDELKGIDLLADDCPVRIIITVNALKEGWDCPFAYVLATLADRSSPIDVEQIPGRILRQPHIRPHGHAPLNMSYVLTASAVFSQALDKIVAGLNRAGFSRNDYRTPDLSSAEGSVPFSTTDQPSNTASNHDLFKPVTQPQTPTATDAAVSAPVAIPTAADATVTTDLTSTYSVDTTLRCGEIASCELDPVAANLGGQYIAPEQREMMDNYPLRNDFAIEISGLRMPQFYRRVAADSLFAETDGGTLLDRDMLLERFRLVDCDVNDFKPNLAAGDVAQIDLKALSTEGMANYEPTRVQLKAYEINKIRDYLATQSPESKRAQLAGLISSWLGKMPPLGEPDLRAYIDKLLVRMSPAELENVLEQHAFVEAVRKRVRLEMAHFRRKTFAHWVRTDEVFTSELHTFPNEVHPVELYPPSANTLYEREERARSTNLESRMADWLAASPNIRWWHRNHQTRGFYLNGPINHYPDFIVRTQQCTIVLIETKGEHLQNDDSDTKVELGKLWQECAGRNYRYIMVFDQTPVDGAVNWQDGIDMLSRV
ncbi:DEAD/DEAH box helicase family protein [Methylobacter sp.]|uniref:DEAD/DEAH box helicase n=1 Tax=Methylobacter sp. TaxID=2051955 RepID=UPI002488BC03|nr:DEAD/DEAH box helicase family protein [Methylobacter sp.]MDI1278883.1 DEAD/DEAH box helicase family protein [Methylobacter sp.]MDI1359681.1 DEAD/DEAH box helicase family protein [Methylobacter sp.]